MTFPGAEAGLAWKDWSPRIGLTYDLTGDGRNVVKFSYGRYVGQLGTGNMSSTYNTLVTTYVRYPWVDVNGDKSVTANEVVLTPIPLNSTGGYNYNNPTQTSTTGKVDPDLTSDKTDEILVSFDREIGPEFAVGASYIWRKYTNFRWSPTDNWSSANFRPVEWTPNPATCPAGATCPTVTYYERLSQPGTAQPFTLFGHVRIVASMDVFNLFNGNTTLSIRGTQNASNANQISSILAPRVMRFGVRATW